MCSVCMMTPCDSRCPNAEEAKPVHECIWCKEPIFEGDEYYDSPVGPVCKECIEEESAEDFMKLIGETFTTAEKETM